MNKAFTLLELLLVVILIGVLASLSFLDLQKSMEKNRAKAAEYNLKSIYDAQKRYKLDNGIYFTCLSLGDNTNAISKALFPNPVNADVFRKIEDPFFTYDIQPVDGGGYKATAKRKSGMCVGSCVIITEVGGSLVKECPVWK